MTTPAESHEPVVLDDEWEPPPRERRSPVSRAAIGLVVAVVAFLSIRAIWTSASPRRSPDWEEQQPVTARPAEPRWSLPSATTLAEVPEAAAPISAPQPPPRAQIAGPRRVASRSAAAPSRRAAPPPPPPAAPTPAAAPGYVSINSKPWTEVSVDGSVIGNTPLRAVRVTSGRHQLVFSHEGFETLRTSVLVQPGDTLRMTDIVLKRSGS